LVFLIIKYIRPFLMESSLLLNNSHICLGESG
jgi:hypothetical protein